MTSIHVADNEVLCMLGVYSSRTTSSWWLQLHTSLRLSGVHDSLVQTVTVYACGLNWGNCSVAVVALVALV